jgi:hypothetical protein
MMLLSRHCIFQTIRSHEHPQFHLIFYVSKKRQRQGMMLLKTCACANCTENNNSPVSSILKSSNTNGQLTLAINRRA